MVSTKWFAGDDNLSDAFYIRRTVFIDEQKIPENLEFDYDDKIASHIVVYENTIPVACGRLILKDGKYFIGRIAVVKEYRGKKYGDLVVRMLIRKSFDSGASEVHIHAQTKVSGFYESLGFTAYGEVFDEACIEHIKMVRNNDVFGCCG